MADSYRLADNTDLNDAGIGSCHDEERTSISSNADGGFFWADHILHHGPDSSPCLDLLDFCPSLC